MSATARSDDFEAQYNPRKAVPDSETFAIRGAALSAETRQRHAQARFDLRYGEGALATLDVFPAAQANAPVHVFVHGGYWRGRDKSEYSYVADALVPLGFTTVIMNYDLCPAVELPAVVSQTREAFQWIHAHAHEWGGDPGAITATGHSAGAHLIAAALPRAGEAPAAWAPRAAVLVSGIYELEPVLSISVNQEIRLRPEQVDPMSPMRHPPAPLAPFAVAAGGGEPDAWVKQSRDFAKAYAAAGGDAVYVELPGMHHFSILSGLERPGGALARLVAAYAGAKA
jgi:arylformamidase